jgi:tripartite-type tricarboxylate transporter receptor subunit TctC
MHPYQHEKLSYDPARDLNPIAKLSRTLLVLAAPATLPANDLKEFVALVRAKPGQMNYGMTPGFTEFVFEGFLQEQGLTMSKVPYRDIIQAPTDLAQDRIQILGVTHAVASGQMQAGRVKLLAVSAAQRSDLVPDVPTVHELGFPKLESITMIGVWGPPSMSLDLRKRISEDMIEPLRDPDIVRRLRAASHVLEPAGPEQFTSELQKLEAQIASIAQTLGVTRKK